MKTIKVIAPGKVILSGEHAVVYGYPAFIAAVDRCIELEVTKTMSGLEVDPPEASKFVRYAINRALSLSGEEIKNNLFVKMSSSIPQGSGMGSSAAAAVAISASMVKLTNQKFSLKNINKLAYEIEKKYHSNPSGVDNTASTYGGYLWYRKESEKLKIFSKIQMSRKLSSLYMVNSGKPKETTSEMVLRTNKLFNRKPRVVLNIFKKIERVTRMFLQHATSEATYNVGELIRENERLLEKLGVVSRSTVSLISKIEKIGGAAKVSGAGGIRGSSGILLVYHKNEDKLRRFSGTHHIVVEKLELGGRGVRVEASN